MPNFRACPQALEEARIAALFLPVVQKEMGPCLGYVCKVHLGFLLQGFLLLMPLPQPSLEQGAHGVNTIGPSNGPCP